MVKEMNAIGSIRIQSVLAERVREMNLERSVATVSQDEALNGASFSDSVRFATHQQTRDGETVPMHIYLQRAAKFQKQLRAKKTEQEQEAECPIKRARAESLTGENAPLGWLTSDQFGQDNQPPAVGGDARVSEEPSLHSVELEQGMVSFSTPLVNSEPSSLMSEEWLFSPNSY